MNWKGYFDNVEETHSSDDSFKDHFENLLNKNEINVPINNIDVETAPYIPVLDDSFSPIEMEKGLRKLESKQKLLGYLSRNPQNLTCDMVYIFIDNI